MSAPYPDHTAFPLHQRGMVLGVCANLADLAGVPAWLPRLVFVLAGLDHLWLAVIVYGVLAWARHKAKAAPFVSRSAQGGSGMDYGSGRRPTSGDAGLRARFGSLDDRLSQLEAATMSGEADLRRRFRDLG